MNDKRLLVGMLATVIMAGGMLVGIALATPEMSRAWELIGFAISFGATMFLKPTETK